MKKLHISLLFAAADKYLSTLVTLLMTAIVARLLRPDEVGVFAIASIFLMLTESLRDFGVSAYLVQDKTLDRKTLRTAFTLTLILAALLAALLFAASGPIADWYADRRLHTAIGLIALGTFSGAFASTFAAVLRRELRFGALAVINISALVANLLCFVGFFMAGWGYLSLVLSSLAAGMLSAVLTVAAVGQWWMFRPCLESWRGIAVFGGVSSMATILNLFCANLPQLIVGRLSGLDAAGLYNRAFMLCQLPDRLVVGAFQPVVFPALAAEARRGGDLKTAYLHALTLLSAVQMPALLMLVILAEPLVLLILGPQWMECVALLRIMAAAWIFITPAVLTYPILVASGRLKDSLASTAISLPLTAIIIVLAAPHGLEALAWSMFVSLPLQTATALVFVRRAVRFTWRELALSVWRSAVVTICTVAGPMAFLSFAGNFADRPLAVILLMSALAAPGWLAGLLLLKHPLVQEIQALFGTLYSRQRPTAS